MYARIYSACVYVRACISVYAYNFKLTASNHDLKQQGGLTVDAAESGNEGRFVNDYRGIGHKPNVELIEVAHVGGPAGPGKGPKCMAIWTQAKAIPAGQELMLSYGKGYWAARLQSERQSGGGGGERRGVRGGEGGGGSGGSFDAVLAGLDGTAGAAGHLAGKETMGLTQKKKKKKRKTKSKLCGFNASHTLS